MLTKKTGLRNLAQWVRASACSPQNDLASLLLFGYIEKAILNF
jgi:hypothetical protein